MEANTQSHLASVLGDLKMKKRILAISDIHGQYDPFIEVLEKANYNGETDQLILCGDYVDRGPKSRQVIEKIIELVEKDGAIALKGNHDIWMMFCVDFGAHEEDFQAWMSNGGRETLKSYGDDQETLMRHMNWMKDNLKLYHEMEDIIFVHAGVIPNIPIDKQREQELTRIRHQGRCNLGKLIVHGHTPVKEVTQIHDQLFIDTGSVFGNKLTCIELPSGEIWEA
jgi:serine/threonine protein phosphatase 1